MVTYCIPWLYKEQKTYLETLENRDKGFKNLAVHLLIHIDRSRRYTQ
jgi:hypothetical protein